MRSILEDVMLDIMYKIPDQQDISKCIIDKNCISTKKPTLTKKKPRKKAEAAT